MMGAVIGIRDLSFIYPDAHPGDSHGVDDAVRALDGVDLEVAKGEIVLICGPTGCGKTTLMRLMKPSLSPHGDLQGSIHAFGLPIGDLSQRDQAARIGFVMQDPEAQIVTDKVWSELTFGLENLGWNEASMRSRIAEMASFFGMESWFNEDVAALSGGQKQMLNLASAMATDPDVLILDEPTSRLDPIASEELLGAIARLNRELGVTVILSEQRLEGAFAIADRVIAMEDGRIACSGSPGEVGSYLHDTDSPFAIALPTPMRAFFETRTVMGRPEEGAPIIRKADVRADPAPAGRCRIPITIKDGRDWLEETILDAHDERICITDTAPYLPDGDPCISDDGSVDPDVADRSKRDIALRIEDFWFRYGKEEPDILQGASLSIPVGSICTVIGGNGAGKSTLLRAVAGILRPRRGRIDVLGRRIDRWKPSELHGKTVAMLPQEPKDLFARSTVRAELEEMHPLDPTCIERIAEEMGIAAIMEKHPYDISGGEQQKVALAKVLLADPSVLLLDEPTKGLDALSKAELAERLEGLASKGVTVVLASHDIDLCAEHSDMMAFLFDGAVVASGTPAEVLSDNGFYTTAARRMSRGIIRGALTVDDIVDALTGLGMGMR